MTTLAELGEVRPIPGSQHLLISRTGKIWSLKTNRLLSAESYPYNKHRNARVRLIDLIAEVYLGPAPSGMNAQLISGKEVIVENIEYRAKRYKLPPPNLDPEAVVMRDVPGDSRYKVTSDGFIYNTVKRTFLKPYYDDTNMEFRVSCNTTPELDLAPLDKLLRLVYPDRPDTDYRLPILQHYLGDDPVAIERVRDGAVIGTYDDPAYTLLDGFRPVLVMLCVLGLRPSYFGCCWRRAS